MPQDIVSQFRRNYSAPIEEDRQVPDINARNSISTSRRWLGMLVYVVDQNETYILRTGITNTDWEQLTSVINVGVIDNLTSTSTSSALSANQGRILNDRLTPIEGNYVDLTTNQSVGGEKTFTAALGVYNGRLGVGGIVPFGPGRLGDSNLQSINIDTQSVNFKDTSQGTLTAIFSNPTGTQLSVKSFNDSIQVLATAGLSADQTNNSREVESTNALLNEYNDGSSTIFDMFNQDYPSGTSLEVRQAMGHVAIHRDGAAAKKIGLWRFDGTTYTKLYEFGASDNRFDIAPVVRLENLAGNGVGVVGVDNNGELSFSAGGGGAFLPLAGGTMTGDIINQGNSDAVNVILRDFQFTNAANTDADKRVGMIRARTDDGATGTRGGVLQFVVRRPNTALSFDFPLELYHDQVKLRKQTEVEGGLNASGVIRSTGNYLEADRGFRSIVRGTANANNWDTEDTTYNSYTYWMTSNTTGSTNFPTSFGMTQFFKGATEQRSFALYKVSAADDNRLYMGYLNGSSQWQWSKIVLEGMVPTFNQNEVIITGASPRVRFQENSFSNQWTMLQDGNNWTLREDNANNTRLTVANGGAATFTSTVTATNFILSSDQRLKRDIKRYQAKRLPITWKTFNWIDPDRGQDRQLGVIAQEVEKYAPEFVTEGLEGNKTVKYNELLIAKVAELEARIEELEAA